MTLRSQGFLLDFLVFLLLPSWRIALLMWYLWYPFIMNTFRRWSISWFSCLEYEILEALASRFLMTLVSCNVWWWEYARRYIWVLVFLRYTWYPSLPFYFFFRRTLRKDNWLSFSMNLLCLVMLLRFLKSN